MGAEGVWVRASSGSKVAVASRRLKYSDHISLTLKHEMFIL